MFQCSPRLCLWRQVLPAPLGVESPVKTSSIGNTRRGVAPVGGEGQGPTKRGGWGREEPQDKEGLSLREGCQAPSGPGMESARPFPPPLRPHTHSRICSLPKYLWGTHYHRSTYKRISLSRSLSSRALKINKLMFSAHSKCHKENKAG